jgi:hypothetical protein
LNISFPPPGMASRGLIARLSNAVESWKGSTIACQASGLQPQSNLDVLAERRPQQFRRVGDKEVDVDLARRRRRRR